MKRRSVFAVALALGLVAMGVGAAPAAAASDDFPPEIVSVEDNCLIDPDGPYLLPCAVCDIRQGPPFKDC